jgi:hypothetical protein
MRSAEVFCHLPSTGERKPQKEGCERRAQIGWGPPRPRIILPCCNTRFEPANPLSMTERLYAESCKTDVNSAYINRLPMPFIAKYLMRILCSDFSILIFNRSQKRNEEKLNVSSDRNCISNFRCQYVNVQLMLYILPPSNKRWGLAISV